MLLCCKMIEESRSNALNMKNIIILVLLLITSQAQAAWSDFAYVIPETENKYKLDIEFSPVENRANTYRIKFKAVGYSHKQAWLIVTADSLSKKEQELRNFIWQAIPPSKVILIKALLNPVNNKLSSKDELSLYYEVELSSTILKKAYIYIDFPSVVFDGGYYYTIDLSAFLTEYEKNASK